MEPIKPRDSSLASRVAVGILFAPLVLWLFWTGGYTLFAFLALITFLAQGELFGMPQEKPPLAHRIVSHLAGIAILADASFNSSGLTGGIAVAAIIGFFLAEIVSTAGGSRLGRVLYPLFVSFYPAAFLAYLPKIARFPLPLSGADNRTLLLLIVAAVWTFDIASYFTGSRWGRRRFFPSISPRKTCEGFIGGVLGTLALGAAAGTLTGLPFLHAVTVPLLAALAGQAGDLSESIIKRDMNVKDSSRILLGHGGILDRFDSLFFAAPAAYAYLYINSAIRGGCG